MNVTVLVPPVLRPAMEGRASLDLGVPASADVADVLQTLLSLYPRLRGYVPGDQASGPTHLALGLSEPALARLATGRPALREGQKVYLFASGGPPPGATFLHGRD